MKKLLFVFFVFCAFILNAQTMEVSGNQSGTWSGEIYIVGDVVVPEHEILTIEPGTSVIARGYFGITVNGGLTAVGTENTWIEFTVADTTGYYDYEIVRGGWKGIRFVQCTDNVRLSYCDFNHGKTQIGVNGGALNLSGVGDVEIAHCVFHDNKTRWKGGAMYAENSNLYIHDCEVYNNEGNMYDLYYCYGAGFQFLKCDINMHDMVFHDNIAPSAYGGGMNVDSCNLELKNAVFYNNQSTNAGGLGIQRSKHLSVKVSNMLAYNNAVVHYGGGIATATSDPELNNITIVNNYCGGGGGAGMQMAFDAAPTLNNCIFYGNHAIFSIDGKDTTEYYNGSQIWLWGDDCRPTFNNGDVQYGLDSIFAYHLIEEGHYNNMILDDPMFLDMQNHDYRLSDGSPCIDTGTPDITGLFIPDTDLSGGLRVVNGRIDMGCYEWGSIGVNEINVAQKTISVFPNPLNINSVCEIKLSKKSDITLKLISLDGKEIYREECGIFESGEAVIPLDGIIKNVERKNNMYLLIIDTQYDRYFDKMIY